ncbi:hypothetical protein Syun_021173 [Stephania yunnanensis]|uniref:Uncharacterized protein n=1 Tax=Stephania yunnanensis TaxID=152371 RepID=A0AAP0IGL0_9MAGN
MTDQELELELNEAGRASATPAARLHFLFQFVQFSSLPFLLLNNFLVVSNCALNMACEILQLELGNMNLRLFGSPGKFYGQAQAHETDRLRQVIEKEMLKVETLMVECRDRHYKFDVSHCSSTLALSPMMLINGSNSISDSPLISNGSETEIIRNGIYSVSDPSLNQKRNSVSDPSLNQKRNRIPFLIELATTFLETELIPSLFRF